MNQSRDFPWSPIAEAIQDVVRGFAIVCAMSICGWAVGDLLAMAWLRTGVSHHSDLAHFPEMYVFTPEVFLAVLVSFVRLYQCLCFPTPGEIFKAGAVPFVVWTFAMFSTIVRLGAGPPPSPHELIGEWVREDARFHGEVLAEGEAMYLSDDGSVSVFGAEPLVARRGQATFDKDLYQFTFVFPGSASVPEVVKMKVVFDRAERRLKIKPGDGNAGSYTERQRKIPRWVRDATKWR